MTLYKKKYRAETIRLTNHSYRDGMYFVTICTKKKLQWFGEIVDKKMTLNEVGEIVKDEWLKTPIVRSYVKLDAWCVMPNHIHGIILIDNVETCGAHVSLMETGTSVSEATSVGEKESHEIIETRLNTDMSKTSFFDSETCAPHVSTKKLLLPPKGLASIINQFKGTVTKKIHSMGHSDFHWQPRYHDHIIQSKQELNAIRTYIRTNPNEWDKETIPWHADGVSWSL